jgi:ATP-dependent DNA helicase RecQ
MQIRLAPAPLQAHLDAMLGPGATFRDGQREAIEAVVRDGARALVVQRTGWGKSLVYWIATRVRRDEGHGPTLIISPLLALMRNQIAMAARLGLRATTIHSGNKEEWAAVEQALALDAVDVLLISPERLANEDFTARVLPSIRSRIGLFVVDEAHCISDWGHDFRPDYRRIGRILSSLAPTVPVLATTATANDRVVADVAEQLAGDVAIVRGPLTRESLRLDAIVLADQAERLAWLAEQLPRLPGSGIVYCLTVADTTRVAGWLTSRGIDARPYNAALPQSEREALEDALIAGEMKALVATVALGMGFDKPDLGFVVHYQRPGSAIAYYQQVGRAGRAVERAHGVLLSGREDDEIADYFIRTAFPPTARMHEVLAVLEEVDSASWGTIERGVNMPRGQIAQALKLLELDGAVARQGGRYIRTETPWEQDEERVARLVAVRRAELETMRAYQVHDGCLMEFLARQLDDPAAAPCGHCANDGGDRLPRDVNADLVHAAMTFLRRDLRPIAQRRQWAAEAVAGLSGGIKPPNEPGVALSVFGDAGWGRDVSRARRGQAPLPRGLLLAAASTIRDRWRPEPAPEWVTSVPSARGSFVRDVARALAGELRLPYVETFATSGGEPQNLMENSVQQLRNVAGKLSLAAHTDVRGGPVLLVDDLVDSGWTLTWAGWLLRSAGGGPVHPFTLAEAGGGDS